VKGTLTFEPFDSETRKRPQSCFNIQTTTERAYYLMSAGPPTSFDLASTSAAQTACQNISTALNVEVSADSSDHVGGRRFTVDFVNWITGPSQEFKDDARATYEWIKVLETWLQFSPFFGPLNEVSLLAAVCVSLPLSFLFDSFKTISDE